MGQNKRVTAPMRVTPDAYLMMARMYREKAQEVRVRYLTQEDRNRISRMLEDAASDYEATAQEMSQS